MLAPVGNRGEHARDRNTVRSDSEGLVARGAEEDAVAGLGVAAGHAGLLGAAHPGPEDDGLAVLHHLGRGGPATAEGLIEREGALAAAPSCGVSPELRSNHHFGEPPRPGRRWRRSGRTAHRSRRSGRTGRSRCCPTATRSWPSSPRRGCPERRTWPDRPTHQRGRQARRALRGSVLSAGASAGLSVA